MLCEAGVMRLEALQGTGKGGACEARNDLILTILFFWNPLSWTIVTLFSRVPLTTPVALFLDSPVAPRVQT